MPARVRDAVAGRVGVGVVAGSRLIPVRVGDIEIEVEAVAVAGTEPTSGRAAKAAANVLEAFGRAQDAIIEVAKSTAQMIEKAGAAARPDRVEVEFGLKFSASGGVIMAGVAGEASLKVTLGYDVAARPAASPPRGGRRRSRCLPGRRAGVIVTAAAGVPDRRVPGYLGRVLDAATAPVGTCFQVAPGVLVTAWHVLDDIGAASRGRPGAGRSAGAAGSRSAPSSRGWIRCVTWRC